MCPSNSVTAQLAERIRRVSNDFSKQKERRMQKEKGPQKLGGAVVGLRRSRVLDTQEATILFFNLHPSVQGADLCRLFSGINLKSLVIDLNQDGFPTGSGHIKLPKSEAPHFIQKFTGIQFNGLEMKFTLAKRVSLDEEHEGKREVIDLGSDHSTPRSTPRSTPMKMSPLREQRKEHVGRLVRRLVAKDLSPDVITNTFSNLTI